MHTTNTGYAVCVNRITCVFVCTEDPVPALAARSLYCTPSLLVGYQLTVVHGQITANRIIVGKVKCKTSSYCFFLGHYHITFLSMVSLDITFQSLFHNFVSYEWYQNQNPTKTVCPNTPGTLTWHTWYLNIAHLVP